MTSHIFYTAGHTQALTHAIDLLKERGIRFSDHPGPDVTDLLLDIPSFRADGRLRSGDDISSILSKLSADVTIVGGNLQTPVLQNYTIQDLLQDPVYVAENADITAHCAVKLALQNLPVILKGCNVLVVGWGRIGKCLARLLKQMGAIVTVAARKEADRALLLALGYDTLDASGMGYELLRFRLIFNTAPVMLLPKQALTHCHPDCLKIDLASMPGIEANDVIWARGIPNTDAPETSGALIARTILRLCQERSYP